ncbi:MAG: hypothetical protein AB7G15_15820 [Alphaproteobacteria bacterium]
MPSFPWPVNRAIGRYAAVLIAVGLGLLVGLGAVAETPPPNSPAVAAFEKIAAVLQHPRCENCHQKEAPLQTDAGRVHIPRVTRGTDNLGVGAMRCANCHRDENNAASNVPGAPQWQMAPRSMSWTELSVPEICRALKDKSLNGNRDLAAIVDHVTNDKLLRWAWSPGGKRAVPPIGHQEFVDLIRVWVAGGGECPPGSR